MAQHYWQAAWAVRLDFLHGLVMGLASKTPLRGRPFIFFFFIFFHLMCAAMLFIGAFFLHVSIIPDVYCLGDDEKTDNLQCCSIPLESSK